MVEIIFETHASTTDNEQGIATGWLPGELSPAGREQAVALGQRRGRWAEVVFTSDLRRAVQTAEIAFAGMVIPIVRDPRLRECDYGDLNGSDTASLPRLRHIDVPFPNGESYRQVVARVGEFLVDLGAAWEGRRLVVIGHTATRWAIEHLLLGRDLAEAVAAPFAWQPGWAFRLP
ncbi:MAG TPA: histidine phosphatase family protein [Bacillota bacterium]|nr:histidine phosphatase family protein [Bacillota bacterium]